MNNSKFSVDKLSHPYFKSTEFNLNISPGTAYVNGYRANKSDPTTIKVDRALTSDDLPEYMQGKRDSIVIQVKNGKSVEQAIGLMRAIFG